MVRVLALVLMVLVGCSSDEPGADGGGSAASGGESSGRVCTPGTTQECVGPGACKGGQACAFDGSGWSPCDCGQGGSSSGGSGSPSMFPAAGTGGQPTAGMSSGGSGGQVGQAGGEPGGEAGSAQAGQAQGGAGAAQAGSGQAGSGQAGSGQAGSGQAGMTADADCPKLGEDCQKCCDANHPGVQKDFAVDLYVCACQGECLEQCMDICGGANSGVVCNECLNTSFKSGACVFDSCSSASCKAFTACVLSCP